MGLYVDIEKEVKGFILRASFEARKGCTGILGASGCGKSMTLKAIAGIEPLKKGRIRKDDIIFYDAQTRIHVKPQKRKTGFLFQNYALFPNMTVEENLWAGLSGRTKENRERVEGALHRFHLTGLETRYPGKLSGGQQQRTALARILAGRPDILLLDEPFSALDAYLKEELQMELLEILKEFDGYTILVTHDRGEAYRLCEDLMIMENGKIAAHGRTKEMFRHPADYQTARLTGCKNLSGARKAGRRRVYAVDWGMELTVSEQIPEELAYVGIRAHDFEAALQGDGLNIFSVNRPLPVAAPFEENIIFRAPSGEKLWWKKERKTNENESILPPYVTVRPDKIMLLLP